MATKAALDRELHQAWQELQHAVQSVPADECDRAGVVGDWTLKDVLGHIAFWSDHAAQILACVGAGRPQDVPLGEGESWVDEWNDREYQARRPHPFTEVRAEWLRNHERAARALEEIPEDRVEVELRRGKVADYFAGDTYEHYREHADQIREWQTNLSTTEA